jgi:hypothetical protein
MPEPWKLTRAGDGVYSLIYRGKYLADVQRRAYGSCPWCVWYAMRHERWRKYEDFFTLKEARAWIGEHLEELAKGESVNA